MVHMSKWKALLKTPSHNNVPEGYSLFNNKAESLCCSSFPLHQTEVNEICPHTPLHIFLEMILCGHIIVLFFCSICPTSSSNSVFLCCTFNDVNNLSVCCLYLLRFCGWHFVFLFSLSGYSHSFQINWHHQLIITSCAPQVFFLRKGLARTV